MAGALVSNLAPVVDAEATATQALPTPFRRPRPKGIAVDTRTYARFRASGSTQREALLAAGSTVRTLKDASRQAGRIEARPEYAAEYAEAAAAVEAMTDKGWRASLQWALDVAEDKNGADGKPPTNLDRHNAAVLFGKIRGAFVQRLEVVSVSCVAAFDKLGGNVPGE